MVSDLKSRTRYSGYRDESHSLLIIIILITFTVMAFASLTWFCLNFLLEVRHATDYEKIQSMLTGYKIVGGIMTLFWVNLYITRKFKNSSSYTLFFDMPALVFLLFGAGYFAAWITQYIAEEAVPDDWKACSRLASLITSGHGYKQHADFLLFNEQIPIEFKHYYKAFIPLEMCVFNQYRAIIESTSDLSVFDALSELSYFTQVEGGLDSAQVYPLHQLVFSSSAEMEERLYEAYIKLKKLNSRKRRVAASRLYKSIYREVGVHDIAAISSEILIKEVQSHNEISSTELFFKFTRQRLNGLDYSSFDNIEKDALAKAIVYSKGDLRNFYRELQGAETSALPLIEVVGVGSAGSAFSNAMFIKMVSPLFVLVLWLNFTWILIKSSLIYMSLFLRLIESRYKMTIENSKK